MATIPTGPSSFGVSDTASQEALLQNLLVQNGGYQNYASVPAYNQAISSAETSDSIGEVDQVINPPGGVYTYYDVLPRFVKNPGMVELAGTNDEEDVAFCQVKQPTIRLVVEWVAEREGQAPVIPSSTLTADCVPVLLLEEITPTKIEILPGGAYKYKVMGRYTYGFKKPALVQVNAAVLPWTRDLGNVAVAMGGGLAGAAFNLLLDQAAAAAAATTSDTIINVGPTTPESSLVGAPLPPVVGA